MWSHKGCYNLRSMEAHSDNLGKLAGAHNVLAYGPKGNGMMRIVQNMLERTGIISSKVDWSFVDCRLNSDNKNTIGVLVRRNTRCMEIIMRDFGTNERYIVKNIIQKISESFVISETNELVYKIIVIHNIEHFSDESQRVLAVFAEKHSRCTRYFFTTNQYNSIYRGLLTQCASYRVSRPEEHELLQLYPGSESHDRHLENFVDRAQMRSLGVQESSADRCFDEIHSLLASSKLKAVRDIVYALLVNNVSGNTIITALTERSTRAHPGIASEIVRWAAEYDHRLAKCERPMYHIEAFFVRLSLLITSDKSARAS